MARRKPAAAPAAPQRSWHPALAAGACVEVWAADVDAADPMEVGLVAWSRHRRALRAWLLVHDIPAAAVDERPEPLRWTWSPWSFYRLASEVVAQRLEQAGLPASWQPSPAPPLLRDLPRRGPLSPRATALLIGHLR